MRYALSALLLHRGEAADAPALSVHFVKSISWLQPLQICLLLNSSEKISISFPQLGHWQTNDFRFLNCSNPGQCCGVLMTTSRIPPFVKGRGITFLISLMRWRDPPGEVSG